MFLLCKTSYWVVSWNEKQVVYFIIITHVILGIGGANVSVGLGRGGGVDFSSIFTSAQKGILQPLYSA